MSIVDQGVLFSNSQEAQALPEGFRYRAEILTKTEETELVAALKSLPFKPFDFHGHLGNRHVVSFGLRYDYGRRAIELADQPPAFLERLRTKIAEFARRPADEFKQIGVNEYRLGAGIGWHKDKPQFGEVLGVSIGSAVRMRFRMKRNGGWIRESRFLEPRSAYQLSGPAREVWEHSIAPVSELRYSVTFRTLNRRG
jgi:alkylated DNA repair dioxygenase AlkB